MDDLCYIMENTNPLSDSNEEYNRLHYSSSISLQELADSMYLRQTVHRYQQYLKYCDFFCFSEYHTEVILFLINDFLAGTEFDLLRAAKCVSIDTHMIRLIDDMA